MTSPRELVAVYADESCLGNGRDGENPGGAGALVEYRRRESGPIVRRDLWLCAPATTNNRMALQSVIETMKQLGAMGGAFDVVFTTDSRYIVDGMTEWTHGWARRGWTRKAGPIENLKLWFAAIDALDPHRVRWQWVRGHAGHAQNEYANHLATTAAATQTASNGLVSSRFDDWYATAGAKHAGPQGFPDSDSFRPHPPPPAPPSVSR